MASKTLPPGKACPLGTEKAAEILACADSLRPREERARLLLAADNSFQFPSSVITSSPKNNTVHGRLYYAGKSWASRPMVILVHGWNAELHYLYLLPRLARALNRRGLNAALIELPYHLHRRPHEANEINDFISDDLPGMLLATRQAIADVHSLGLWARAQGCPRLAVWGFSLGAWLMGLYICESDLPGAAVLTTPVSDLARGVRDLAFCHPIRASLAGASIDLGPLNLFERSPKIAAAAIQLVQSSYDLFVPAESYAELAAAWKLPRWEQHPQSHISILVSRKAMKQSIDFLAERLN